jgi:hypothetical protein
MNILKYDNFIHMTLIIKYIFVILLILEIVFSRSKNLSNYVGGITKIKNFFEHIFSLLLGFLLMYLFYPFKEFPQHLFTYETKLLLCLFGFLNIIYFIKDVFS